MSDRSSLAASACWYSYLSRYDSNLDKDLIGKVVSDDEKPSVKGARHVPLHVVKGRGHNQQDGSLEQQKGNGDWLWRGFGEIRIMLSTNDLLGFGVGFGWLWAISNSLIPGSFLALGVGLGVLILKDFLALGKFCSLCNSFLFLGLVKIGGFGKISIFSRFCASLCLHM